MKPCNAMPTVGGAGCSNAFRGKCRLRLSGLREQAMRSCLLRGLTVVEFALHLLQQIEHVLTEWQRGLPFIDFGPKAKVMR